MLNYSRRMLATLTLVAGASLNISSATSATFETLWRSGSNDEYPFDLATDVDGTIYGTTQYGGVHDKGTVFGLTPPTAEGESWTYKLIHSFRKGHPGTGVLIGPLGELYGTKRSLDGSTSGRVYKLTPPTPNSNGNWIEDTVYSFKEENRA